jgi:transposase
MKDRDHELEVSALGALPIINAYFAKLALDKILDRYVPSNDRRLRMPHAQVLLLLLRNIIIRRRPLYSLREWSQTYSAAALGIDGIEPDALTDDRAGRALDALFDADRASFLTELITRAIRTFEIDVERFHNDSTSITFSGEYAAALGRTIRGKRALRVTWGHNKDHRPDLKQLLWNLTVSSDGAVPVHYRVHDGNTSDDPTHIETWNTLRRLAGRPDFIYVADCKLCTKTNMDHIESNGGRFVTVLPRSRREDAWFREQQSAMSRA